jgi:O-antigen/teichoic acid export membrane protein
MGTVQRQSLSLTIISYAGAVLGMVNKVFLLTNFLDASQVGLINVLTTVAILYAQFAALGMGSVGIRFFPYFENRDKKHNGFLFWGNLVILVGFVITSIVFMLFKPLIVKDYSESPMLAEYYNYLIPFAFAVVYFQFFDTYLRALIKTTIATFINEILGRVAVTVCIALYAFKWIDFHQFVILYVVGNCSLTLILMAYMWYLKQLHIMPASGKMFKRMFKAIALYGIFTILSSLGGALIKSIDTIMVTGMLNLAKAGIYTTIFYFPTVISLPFRSLQRTTYPLIARYWRKRDMTSMYDLYKKTTLVNMIIGGVLTLGIWANLDFIFSFMPKEYADGKYVFLFLAISVYVDMITGLNGIILVTSKKYKYDLWFLLLLIAVTVIMNLVFIPIYGITGAAIAAAASVVINNIARVWFVQYFFKMQPFTLNCLWILLLTAAVWVISLFIPQTGNKYVNAVMNSAIIGLAYALPVLLLKLSPDVNKLAYGITGLKFLKPAEDSSPTS